MFHVKHRLRGVMPRRAGEAGGYAPPGLQQGDG